MDWCGNRCAHGHQEGLGLASSEYRARVRAGFVIGVNLNERSGRRTRADSDEAYVIDLCDQLLGQQASRQHRFEWLLGDPSASGRRVRLPVDAFWPGLGLVVEYRERQHDFSTPFFDKPDRVTVSGVHRGLQRALYDRRREELIPPNGLRLIVVRPMDLDSDARGRLRRSDGLDLASLAEVLMLNGPDEQLLPEPGAILAGEHS